jgi:hypothetical protein
MFRNDFAGAECGRGRFWLEGIAEYHYFNAS